MTNKKHADLYEAIDAMQVGDILRWRCEQAKPIPTRRSAWQHIEDWHPDWGVKSFEYRGLLIIVRLD